MTPRDRVIRALNHKQVDRVPRDLWIQPGMETEHADELAELCTRFPADVQRLEAKPVVGKRSKGMPTRGGNYTDAWGCTWQLGPRGAAGPLVESPLADPDKMADYEPPEELLEAARFSKINKTCEGTLRFVLVASEARPLDRLMALRGPEAAAAEMVAGNKELRNLLVRVNDLYRRELALWAATNVDGVAIHDDLASPTGLRTTARVWRTWLKPLYREYCEILHAQDKFVFFQSAGQVFDIFDDLVEVGFDAIQAQWFLMDFEKLAQKFRGHFTFWSEIDRQQIEPPCGRPEIHEAVLRIRRALDFGAGGLLAQCGWGPSVPLRNVVAYFEEWMTPLPVNA